MSSLRSLPHPPSIPLLASVAILFATVAMPADAQQHVEVSTRRAPRAEPADSNERHLRRLQRELDSLTTMYNDADDLTSVDRRRIERDVARTVERLEDLSIRMGDDAGARTPRASEVIRMRVTPEMMNRAGAEMSRALMQVKEAQQAMPRGWMGFVADGANMKRIEDGELVVRYFSYPRIVSVDPGTPAQRAGIIQNDTLVAYDGRDVRENDISLTRLLRPNAKVSVRVRRDGKLREIPVIVAEAPSRISQRRGAEVSELSTPWPEPATFPRSAMLPPAAPQPSRVMLRAPGVVALQPAMPGERVYSISITQNGQNGVAGAQLNEITPGFARALGVSSGVLVVRAPVGSPANESGLVDGDVITKVGGQSVQTVEQFRDLVQQASENRVHSIELEIVREKRSQKIQLRW